MRLITRLREALPARPPVQPACPCTQAGRREGAGGRRGRQVLQAGACSSLLRRAGVDPSRLAVGIGEDQSVSVRVRGSTRDLSHLLTFTLTLYSSTDRPMDKRRCGSGGPSPSSPVGSATSCRLRPDALRGRDYLPALPTSGREQAGGVPWPPSSRALTSIR